MDELKGLIKTISATKQQYEVAREEKNEEMMIVLASQANQAIERMNAILDQTKGVLAS